LGVGHENERPRCPCVLQRREEVEHIHDEVANRPVARRRRGQHEVVAERPDDVDPELLQRIEVPGRTSLVERRLIVDAQQEIELGDVEDAEDGVVHLDRRARRRPGVEPSSTLDVVDDRDHRLERNPSPAKELLGQHAGHSPREVVKSDWPPGLWISHR